MGTYRQPAIIKRDEGAFTRGFEKGIKPLEDQLAKEQEERDLQAKQSQKRSSQVGKVAAGIKADLKQVTAPDGLEFTATGGVSTENNAKSIVLGARELLLRDGNLSEEDMNTIGGIVGNVKTSTEAIKTVINSLSDNETFDLSASNLKGIFGGMSNAEVSRAYNNGGFGYTSDGSGIAITKEDGTVVEIGRDDLATLAGGTSFAIKADMNQITTALSKEIAPMVLGDSPAQNKQYQEKFESDVFNNVASSFDQSQFASVYYQALNDKSYNPEGKENMSAYGRKMDLFGEDLLKEKTDAYLKEGRDEDEAYSLARNEIQDEKKRFAIDYVYSKTLERQKGYAAGENGLVEFIGKKVERTVKEKQQITDKAYFNRNKKAINKKLTSLSVGGKVDLASLPGIFSNAAFGVTPEYADKERTSLVSVEVGYGGKKTTLLKNDSPATALNRIESLFSGTPKDIKGGSLPSFK